MIVIFSKNVFWKIFYKYNWFGYISENEVSENQFRESLFIPYFYFVKCTNFTWISVNINENMFKKFVILIKIKKRLKYLRNANID